MTRLRQERIKTSDAHVACILSRKGIDERLFYSRTVGSVKKKKRTSSLLVCYRRTAGSVKRRERHHYWFATGEQLVLLQANSWFCEGKKENIIIDLLQANSWFCYRRTAGSVKKKRTSLVVCYRRTVGSVKKENGSAEKKEHH